MIQNQTALPASPLARITGVCQYLRCDGALPVMLPTLDTMREMSVMVMNGHVVSICALCLTALCGLFGQAITSTEQASLPH